MPLRPATWVDREPGAVDAFRQVFSVFVCGLRRPFWTFGLTLLLAAALGGAMFLARSQFSPHIVLRVTESNADPTAMPKLKRQLGDYVQQAVFTSSPLMDIILRHKLYPKAMRVNPRAALDSFRKEIEVDVYQNYFVEERTAAQAPRSARVSIGFRSDDPEIALSVTRELGALVMNHERRIRREQAVAAADEANRAREALNAALQQRGRDVAEKRAELDAAGVANPQLQVELVSLMGSLEALALQAESAELRASQLELGAKFEGQGMGLSFDVADDASVPNPGRRGPLALLVAGIAMLFGFPLVAVGVGTFGAPGSRT
jgi:hypothetical protein